MCNYLSSFYPKNTQNEREESSTVNIESTQNLDENDFDLIDKSDGFAILGLESEIYDKLSVQNSNYSHLLGFFCDIEKTLFLINQFIESDFNIENISLIEEARDIMKKSLLEEFVNSYLTNETNKECPLELMYIKNSMGFITGFLPYIIKTSNPDNDHDKDYLQFCNDLKDTFTRNNLVITKNLKTITHNMKKNSSWNFFV